MRQLPPDHILSALHQAAAAGNIITIEVMQDGKKLYLVEPHIFGAPPSENPLEARNFADDASHDFADLWYEIHVLYIKDVGGGKSAVRSDVPGQIVIFAKPESPPEIGRYEIQ